jgi:hypothetical protein
MHVVHHLRHAAPVAPRKPKARLHHRLLTSLDHHLDRFTRGVGHAAAHTFTFIHHHAAASVGILALTGLVIVAAVTRGLIRAAMLRLAGWMGVPRTGPPPPGAIS